MLDDPAASIVYLSPLFPDIKITILHVGLDNAVGWVHWRADAVNESGGEPSATVAICRFNESCIDEYCDVIEARPVNVTNPLVLSV